MAPNATKGRPQLGRASSSRPRRKNTSAITQSEPNFDISPKTQKRKTPAPSLDNAPPKKRVTFCAEPFPSRFFESPPPSSPPQSSTKTSAPPLDNAPPQKRVKFTYAAASSSRLSEPLPPSSPPPQSNTDFDAALTILAILRDAFAAADAEVRRQMARGAEGPSHIGLVELLRFLLCSTDANSRSNGKGKEMAKEN